MYMWLYLTWNTLIVGVTNNSFSASFLAVVSEFKTDENSQLFFIKQSLWVEASLKKKK